MNMNKAFYPFLFSIILASGIYLGYKIQGMNAAKKMKSNHLVSTVLMFESGMGLEIASEIISVMVNRLQSYSEDS